MGRVVDAIGHHPAAVLVQDGRQLGGVGIDHPHPAAPEQHAFPGAVLRKAGVLPGADVVGRQVGEHTDVVHNTGYPVHLQPQAGHLHHAGVAAGVHHPAQQPLQVAALGGGVVQRFPMPRPADPVGAQDAHPASGGGEHRGDQMGGGSLALGAGDADHRHGPGRCTVQADGQLGQRPAAVGHLHHRQVCGQTGRQPFADNPRCPGRSRPGGKSMAVGVQTRQADKQRPRGHGPGIIAQGPDLGAGIPLQQDAVGGRQKGTQFHAASLPKNCSYQTRKQ